MSSAFTPGCSDYTTQKISESHVEGLYIEKLAVCAESGEPLLDEQGQAVIETCVNVGITRGLFNLLLWQWALFGTILVTIMAGWDKGLINLGCTLAFLLVLSMQKLVVKQINNDDVSEVDAESEICVQQS
ncbi:MAG: hypothetical protein D6B28_09660 [Gammaproteobacteria bacterium]|nr:MAG: hypothetical protein D6B28_09660 [Gammaproteobacteria bacterium]